MEKKKILLIDDDLDVIMVIKSRLESKGYEVISAATGEAGLKMITTTNPELIVLDVGLPGMNGFEVCASIKKDSALSRPVIMLTSRNRALDKKFGYLANADAYVIKPQSSEDLLPEIERLLSVK